MAIRSRERENRKTAEGPPPSPEDLCPPSTTASLIECLIDARSVDDDATDDPESRRLEEENQLRRPSLRPTKEDRLVRPPIGPRGKLASAAGFPVSVFIAKFPPSSVTSDILDPPARVSHSVQSAGPSLCPRLTHPGWPLPSQLFQPVRPAVPH